MFYLAFTSFYFERDPMKVIPETRRAHLILYKRFLLNHPVIVRY